MSDVAKCSFCGREKGAEVKVLVQSVKTPSIAICERCAKWADGEEAALAFCHCCTPVDGRHHPNCPERMIA